MITEDKLDARSLLTQADKIMEDEEVRKEMAMLLKRWDGQMLLID